MGLISRLNPVTGLRDFWDVFRQPQPYRIPILLASIAVTCGIVALVAAESVKGPPVRPDVTYITSFAPDRTDAEIIESNRLNQLRKDKVAQELERRLERRKDLYRALGRASGMDVDRIERELAEEEAAAARALDAELKEGERASGQAAAAANRPSGADASPE
ncbi:hypothetical protein HME9302_00265 [Alteripontixanthobacter maritimus]|uniref:Uncharacterized protein n=1 Tax=Alteripontixanthobacter maritimus TaxID=2161824 RepID=A0A369Q7E6_9SPHN|nr:hypothetical protein [Alteripontixanthobacter maritimus]RDC59086.1 hypothetical protein HME9302_00265 [Alteripontixanthobacter maritimus]